MMTPSCSGAVEPNEEGKKNKLNEDLAVFMSKRSDHDAPRYTATLKNYADLQQKRRRAANARLSHYGKRSAPKKLDPPENDGPINNTEHRGGDDERIHKRRGGEKLMQRQRSGSRSQSCEPVDACGRRRRRRRRRSCSMMTPSCSGAVEPNEEVKKNKLNEDLVVFMSKRSDHDAPRYTATLKNYADLQQKRRRAANARLSHYGKRSAPKKPDPPENDGPINKTEHRGGDDERVHKRRGGEKLMQRQRSGSRSQSCEPVDACGRRRRRRRRRSCSNKARSTRY